MTRRWTIEPPPRRGRRVALAVGLVGVFAASLAAGWAVAGTPRGTDGRMAGPAGSPGATSVAVASPDQTPTPTPAPASPTPAPSAAPTPTPTPSPTPVPSPVVSKAMAARLDRALASARKSLGLPGVQATVIFANGSTWTGVGGLADVKTGRKVRPDTPFAIASVTKTFTSALVLRYVDQGRIRLDDRLSKWLPNWPNARKITIRMLLNHTSGIPDYFKNVKLDVALNKNKKRVWTMEQVLADYVRPGVVFAPGKGWSYSNSNYALLGLVAEKVGGASWDVLLRRELIDPLGLDSTYVQEAEDSAVAPARAYRMIAGNRGATPQARTDGTNVVPFTSVVTAAGSAGAIASTTQDLARWARALYGGKVLSAAARRQLFTFVRAYSYGTITSYGLGVSRVRFQGRIAYGHTGALTGTRAAIRYFPKERVTVAVLFNREPFVGDDVVRILARTLFPKPPVSPSPGTSPRPTTTP
jgi:D-alanyl-D-alanine carboxypeptidase